MACPVNLTYLAMSRTVREPVSKIVYSTQEKKTEVVLDLCSGVNKNGPHWLIDLNALSLGSDTFEKYLKVLHCWRKWNTEGGL